MRFKRFISLSVLFVLATTLVVQSAYCCEEEKSSGFSDINQNHWAYKAILNMSSRKIINGFPDNTFRPDLSITRAEFAKIMVLALNLPQKQPDSSSFLDINKTDWECPYVENAKYYLTGFRGSLGDSFHPQEPAVREDMAVALVKAMNLSGENSDSSILDRFSDKSNISENLKKYISIAVNHKIMEGSKDGNDLAFKPKNSLTRAEAAVLLNNVTSEEKITFDEEKVTYDDKDKQPEVTVSKSSHTVPQMSAKVDKGRVIVNWKKISDKNLLGYKVVISKNNPHPKYPDDGYMFWITDRNTTSAAINKNNGYNGGDIDGHLVSGEDYYFSVTAFYEDEKVPGNVVKLTFP